MCAETYPSTVEIKSWVENSCIVGPSPRFIEIIMYLLVHNYRRVRRKDRLSTETGDSGIFDVNGISPNAGNINIIGL